MRRFDFLLGEWNLVYEIPESQFSGQASGKGFGVFKRILNGKFVGFDCTSELPVTDDTDPPVVASELISDATGVSLIGTCTDS